ncbi:MAG: tRNA (N(6)-L-threonylcarbamoyladenosine(37)-C(2))-methylthiotransferase [Methanomicrobiaceae archaeon]|nr:tRNA (N(6)-L-threonylcarbamoyladenosine(37)-C(2))-methylthiotransferase [Methanomicrobiaceae archaeon]
MDRLSNRTIYVESYGCTHNHCDTQKLIALAEAQGCRQVPADEAEVFVLNTCTVVAKTERQMIRRLKAFRDREIVVTGCMPVVQREAIREVCDAYFILPEELQRRSGRAGTMIGPGIGAVQVGSGCLGSCAYCITRCARGRLRSFPEDLILAEIERLAAEGACEIQLTGQDVSAYGMDGSSTLADLLHRIGEIPGGFRVRVGMMNPSSAYRQADDLAEAFSQEKIFSFIHLPVQSGSDRVLAAMRRGYTVADFAGLVAAFRDRMPGVRVSTDLIAGFPTETGEDFRRTLDLLTAIRPTKVNITRYSPRPGTAAAGWGDMPDWIKKERSRALTRAANAIYDDHNCTFIGTELEVLVTEQRMAGSAVARDQSYTTIVIGETISIGTRLRVRITGHRRHYLLGEPVR